MTRRRPLALFLAVSLALIALPAAVSASRDADAGQAAAITFDTPEPTQAPERDRPASTPRPEQTPASEPSPDTLTDAGPTAVLLAPESTTITLGYQEPGLLGQAPFIIALIKGYFAEAGFDDVFIVEVGDTLADLRSGDLDFAVVDATEAAEHVAGGGTSVRAVAGYQNYAEGGAYGGDLVLAGPGLVSDEPATVIAFLSAYIRALQDLADPATAEASLDLIGQTDLAVDADLAAGWLDAVTLFAPFDGGFGSPDEDAGLGELEDHLAAAGFDVADMPSFLAAHALNIAQAIVGLDANPGTGLPGAPGVTDIRVGVPADSSAGSPLALASTSGYFEDAGFSSVDIMDIEQPLLGVLNGELDIGVVSAVDAADGVAQGLPLAVLAGHRNGGADGSGGDVLVASADSVEQEPSTITAFLIAYIRALQDLVGDPDAAAFAPHDGGFGERTSEGGVGDLSSLLADALGAEPDLQTFIAAVPLEYAQAWWGLPANPTWTSAADPGSPDDTQATEGEAAS